MRNGSIFGGDLGGEWICCLFSAVLGADTLNPVCWGGMTDIYVLKPRVTEAAAAECGNSQKEKKNAR